MGSSCLMGTEFVLDDEKVPDMDVGEVAQPCECTKMPLNCTLQKG